jgi:hypothetical protein
MAEVTETREELEKHREYLKMRLADARNEFDDALNRAKRAEICRDFIGARLEVVTRKLAALDA